MIASAVSLSPQMGRWMGCQEEEEQNDTPVFMHMPGSWFPGCPVRQILKSWGWREKEWWSTPFNEWMGNTYVGKCDLFWSWDASLLACYNFPNVQVTNHIDGAMYLCNKLWLGQALRQNTECAARFFPRQYSCLDYASFNAFLKDYAATQDPKDRQMLRMNVNALGNKLPPMCKAILWEFLENDASAFGNSAQAWGNGSWSKHPANPEAQPVVDGPSNAWVVKGIDGGWHGNNGISVSMFTSLQDIVNECEAYNWQCVIQKYLERPLLVPYQHYGEPALHKADLRLWVFVLDRDPLIVFAHPEVYWRVSTRVYKLNAGEKPDPYVHKTNWRDHDNRTVHADLLARCGPEAERRYREHTWPLMMDAVRASLFACQDMAFGPLVHGRPRKPGPPAFELFGYDFALDDEWRPWLLEANMAPSMLDDCTMPALVSFRQEATEAMLASVLAYRRGELHVPDEGALHAVPAPEAEAVPRLFQDLAGGCGGYGNFAGGDGGGPPPRQAGQSCYGQPVANVPACLVNGLSVGYPLGRWLLILRTASSTEGGKMS
eukprot:TRINITY_DN16064_c0_g1_i1.p1 TRINITY_DN16064_c0_g1~~TRINITY_DN16064_c0_g1_i1.p1  ORF type:complete len:546 (-),score=90.55 TRINITY_DN16064_c0_g1_i1:124-1761(-)